MVLGCGRHHFATEQIVDTVLVSAREVAFFPNMPVLD
jgi:hypothetical protein